MMVRGWPEGALIGTFIDDLKPRLSKELKLKQPTHLYEVMRMAKIIENSYLAKRKQAKDVRSRGLKLMQTKTPW